MVNNYLPGCHKRFTLISNSVWYYTLVMSIETNHCIKEPSEPLPNVVEAEGQALLKPPLAPLPNAPAESGLKPAELLKPQIQSGMELLPFKEVPEVKASGSRADGEKALKDVIHGIEKGIEAIIKEIGLLMKNAGMIPDVGADTTVEPPVASGFVAEPQQSRRH